MRPDTFEVDHTSGNGLCLAQTYRLSGKTFAWHRPHAILTPDIIPTFSSFRGLGWGGGGKTL